MEVRNQSHTAVVKYRYNGLGYRILWQWDVDADTVLENDERTYLTYDERWRVVAAFRNSDSTPKERWVHHAAGGRGYGSSSYIDSVALRDRDANAGTGAADGTLEERRYLGQNHRADVSFVAGSDGDALEWVRYSSYGVAYSVPKGDYDADGDVDTSDTTELIAMIAGADGWWKDFNIDGSEDSGDYADHITYRTGYAGGTGGRGVLSRSGVANRVGYAGYQRDPVAGLDHVRHRVLRNDLGRWCTRDPLGYVDGMSLYEYVMSNPIVGRDPSGMARVIGVPCGSGGCSSEPPSFTPDVIPFHPPMECPDGYDYIPEMQVCIKHEDAPPTNSGSCADAGNELMCIGCCTMNYRDNDYNRQIPKDELRNCIMSCWNANPTVPRTEEHCEHARRMIEGLQGRLNGIGSCRSRDKRKCDSCCIFKSELSKIICNYKQIVDSPACGGPLGVDGALATRVCMLEASQQMLQCQLRECLGESTR